MSIPAFSPAWADAFRQAVNTDAGYRDAAARWTNPVALVVEPGEGLEAGVAVQMDLAAGTCLGAEALAPDAVTAPFVLSAGLTNWKRILVEDADPIAAVARGDLRLTRGSIGTLMLHARGAKALLHCARQIATAWP
jgi:putative sterol carrier protein